MNSGEKCRWCGGERHAGLACPLVKAFVFDRRGRITRVEFLTAADFPQQKKAEEPQDYPRLKPIEEDDGAEGYNR
jgi:hypothetical protein